MEDKLPNQEKVIQEQIQSAPTPKKPLPKVLILLVVVLVIGAMLFIAFTILRNQKIQELKNQETTITRQVGSIMFTTPSFDVLNNQTKSSDIEINTGGNAVNGVIVAIKYNPLLIKNVKLEAIKDDASAISQVLEPLADAEYDEINGAALLTLKSLSQAPLSGKGKVARVSFTKAQLNVAVDSTDITFLSSSNFLVSEPGIIPLTKNQITVNF